MARTDLAVAADGSTLERIATALGVVDSIPVARAAFERAGTSVVGRFGRDAAAAAALRVACRRTGEREVDLESAAEAADVDPARLARAETRVELQLSPPASPETVRALRRAIVWLHELLAAKERGRRNPPFVPETVVADADPALVGLANQPLDRLDGDELRAHLRRLEEDLEMARLGVELYALVEVDA